MNASVRFKSDLFFSNSFYKTKSSYGARSLFIPVQQTSQLVPHVDHHHLLPSAGQVGDLALDGLGHTGVDGAAEATVGGDADDQVLGSLVLRGFDLGLLVQGCRRRRSRVVVI